MENFTDIAALLQVADLSGSLRLASTIDRMFEPALRYCRLEILLKLDHIKQIFSWADNRNDVEIFLGMGMLCMRFLDLKCSYTLRGEPVHE
jgi:hypothetical protein